MPFAPELELATADAVAGEITRASKHALPLGTPCPNCATPLAGAWCHACGQKGEEYHRSILHLVAEAFEGLTHVDGRVWNTLPKLVFRPGRLTRAYLDGHRASQIPPFRLFLVALLLVFFAGGLSLGANEGFRIKGLNSPEAQKAMTPEQRVQVQEALKAKGIGLNLNGPEFTKEMTPEQRAQWEALKAKPTAKGGNVDVNLVGDPETNAFFAERIKRVLADPEPLILAMEQWGHRFAILALPTAALLLSVLFAFKKGVYVFDHLIFSMHSLSFQGLLVTVCFLLAMVGDWAWELLWLAPVHLFAHMRGTYRSSILGTLVRMFLLFIGSSIAVSVLMVALVVVGLVTMH